MVITTRYYLDSVCSFFMAGSSRDKDTKSYLRGNRGLTPLLATEFEKGFIVNVNIRNPEG